MKKKQPEQVKRSYLKLAVAASVTVLVLLVLGAAALAYKVSQFPEPVFVAKTTVEGFSESQAGLSATFATFSELDAATKAWATERSLEPLSLESERASVPVTLTALGVSVNWDPIEEELTNYMQSAGLLEKISTFLFGQTVTLPVTIDQSILEQTLAQTGIEQENKNAVFLWDGTTVVIQAGITGYEIQRDELISLLEDSFKNPILEAKLPLTLLINDPDITDAELTALLPDAQALASQNLSFQDEFGNTWDLAMKDHMDWVIPSNEGGELSAAETTPWTLDEAAFISYAETILVPEVEEDPTGAVITENADGSISFEGSARFGKELDKVKLLDEVIERLKAKLAPSAEETAEALAAPLALPINKVMPAVTVPDSLKVKGITDLVGLGYSDFGGSPSGRVHNIQTGIAQYNGIIIDQGAEFSFMGQMSPVDAEHGFLPELVIKGDETIPEYGGGLCQISSTLFRAALYTGLPITARTNHSYAVSYYARPYGYGLDATVYDPAPDLKFVNDTPSALLLQAYTDGDSAYYVFYGTNDQRTVTMEGPYAYDYKAVPNSIITPTDKLAPGVQELKEHGHTGFSVDWYRIVTYQTPSAEELAADPVADPTLYVSPYAATVSGIKEQIHSVYEARPAKYWEGQAGAAGTDSEAAPE